jgi:O-antigen/teichoic acid export membrane protein
LKRFIRLFHSIGLKKGLVYVTIGNFALAGLGALLWFILASQMTASNYGSMNYYISVSTIFTSIGIMGFDSTLTTFLAKGLTKMRTESSSLVLIAGTILSIILLLIFMSLSLMLTFLGVLFFSLSAAEVLGRHLYKEFMILLITLRLISLLSVPLLFSMYGIDGALYGYALSYLPLSYRFFISLRKFDLSLSTLRPNKNFFFHSYALGVSKNLTYFSDKLIILPLFGLGVLGYYQFGVQVLTAMSIIPLILYQYFLPQFAGNKNINKEKIQKFGFFSSVMITIIMIVLVPLIIMHLFPRFENAILPTQIILVAGIPLTMISIFNSILLASEKSVYVIVASGIFLVTQYLLIASLGWLYGLIGLSIATVTASVAQTIYLFIMKKKISLPTSKTI